MAFCSACTEMSTVCTLLYVYLDMESHDHRVALHCGASACYAAGLLHQICLISKMLGVIAWSNFQSCLSVLVSHTTCCFVCTGHFTEGCTIRCSENKMLRNQEIWSARDGGSYIMRSLICNFHCCNICRIKWRRIRWVINVACLQKRGNTCKIVKLCTGVNWLKMGFSVDLLWTPLWVMELVKILCEIHYILWTYLGAAVWGVPTHTHTQ